MHMRAVGKAVIAIVCLSSATLAFASGPLSLSSSKCTEKSYAGNGTGTSKHCNTRTELQSNATVRTKYLFSTPLIRTHLSAFVSDVKSFNEALTKTILEDYDDFLKWTKEVNEDVDAEDRNNDFFLYQVGSDEEMTEEELEETRVRGEQMRFRRSAEFAKLQKVVSMVARHGVTAVLGETVAEQDDSNDSEMEPDGIDVNSFDAWAAVHYKSTRHAQHFHEGSALVAVYYVSVPPGAGELKLYDPRGPRPPFENEVTILPREGDLIMFPGWLGHSVAATGDTNGKPRISVPFNGVGGWARSAEVPGKSFSVPAKEILRAK